MNRTYCVTPVLVAAALLIGKPVSADERDDLFETKIRPILVNSCLRCHGSIKSSATLRVDSRDALLKGGESGPAIVPGKPDESRLIRAIQRHDDVSAMPPEKDKALRPDQIASFVAWVRDGAHWPAQTARFEVARHWAFEPVRDHLVPQVQDKSWVKTDIDSFILARLEAAGIAPNPSADKLTLIRRATFDLTGLPPTPEEIHTFEEDSSPQALATLVDRLLKSPHYGEHWGRHWLDLVRYADTAGENSDHPLPHAWRYRNWVINAFQRNQPFDEFIRDQIAGDLLAAEGPVDQYADRVVATGYLAIARRFGHDIDKDLHLTMEDTIDTLGKSILGLTVACARCHDHKFDPITSRDYYGLYGIFESTRFAFPGCEPQQQPRDLVPLLPPAEFARSIKPVLDRAAALDASIKQLSDDLAVSARQLKESASRKVTVLSSGTIDDGGSAPFVGQWKGEPSESDQIPVRRGDLIQLSITPRTNHGADSTLLEFVIREVGGAQRQWTVADLIDDLTAGNPHADRHGNPATWAFFDTRDGFAFLPESLDQIDGRRELKAWRNGDTPSVFVNTSRDPVKVWTTLPARSFYVHPGPSGPVAVAWLSPIEGSVTVNGRVTDAHPGGGDGVGWVLEQFSSPSATGTEPSIDFAGAFTKTAEQRQALNLARKQRAEMAPQLAVPVAYAVVDGDVKNTRIQKRGEPADLGDEVPRKFLDVLGGQTLQDAKSSGRKELAAWLTSPTNPLTARVFVNRVWQWHFGRGLVTTPNDFGSRGVPPTHPELLDHLAIEFVRSGWNINALHQRIMGSATYQMSSKARQDVPVELYVAFPRRRLTAEELRDALLLVSGQLDLVPGTSHPFPPESTWSFSQHGPFAAEYDTQKRSVYVMQKRNRRTRFFSLFDGPDPNASTPVRDVTIVPTQALFFLNDPFLHVSADKLAARLALAPTDRDKLEIAFRSAFGHSPTSDQVADALEFLKENSWPSYCRILLSSNEFLFVD
ncbi:MAG: PSD1 domain-containing protein [Planctomycetes bacterium]|nr:PSD1 domain-containing protein [Planctomycetota bacterium]